MNAETVGELIEMLKQYDGNIRLENGPVDVKWNNKRTRVAIVDPIFKEDDSCLHDCDVEDA